MRKYALSAQSQMRHTLARSVFDERQTELRIGWGFGVVVAVCGCDSLACVVGKFG